MEDRHLDTETRKSSGTGVYVFLPTHATLDKVRREGPMRHNCDCRRNKGNHCDILEAEVDVSKSPGPDVDMWAQG